MFNDRAFPNCVCVCVCLCVCSRVKRVIKGVALRSLVSVVRAREVTFVTVEL